MTFDGFAGKGCFVVIALACLGGACTVYGCVSDVRAITFVSMGSNYSCCYGEC